MSTELATIQPQPLAPAVSVGGMLQAVIQQGVTSENVGALEKMMALYERMEERRAEQLFSEAFNALQSEMPVIVASSIIPNRGKYERFEDVMRQVGPLLSKHGFSVSFSMDARENRIFQTCKLRHIAGVEKTNTFTVRVGGKADSETQADCKAATTAKRNALLNALNIVIRQDAFQDEDEVANDGAFIAFDQAQTLRELVRETKSDEASFLRFAGASKYEEIGVNRYDSLIAALNRKASGK